MTCKDNCLHWEVCKLTPPEYATAKYYTFCNCAEKCECFKDKSKYIELPCKVGETVYHYCKSVNQIVPYVVEDIHIDKEQTRYFATAFDIYYNEYLDEIEFTEDEIGKTVFLTKSEAEQKLKEMQNG